jgi:hypothetical protein
MNILELKYVPQVDTDSIDGLSSGTNCQQCGQSFCDGARLFLANPGDFGMDHRLSQVLCLDCLNKQTNAKMGISLKRTLKRVVLGELTAGR